MDFSFTLVKRLAKPTLDGVFQMTKVIYEELEQWMDRNDTPI